MSREEALRILEIYRGYGLYFESDNKVETERNYKRIDLMIKAIEVLKQGR
jgi:hypothetical protein